MPFYHLLLPKSHLGLPTTRSFSIFREFGQHLMGERPWEALQKILTTPQPHFFATGSACTTENGTLGVQVMFCFPFSQRGLSPLLPPQSHLAERRLLGFELQEEIHQALQLVLAVDLEGLGSRGTSLRQHGRGSETKCIF